MEVPVSIFQESPLAGEPRERLFHIHSVHRYQLRLCKISLPIYVIVTNKLLQPLTATWYDSLVLSFSMLSCVVDRLMGAFIFADGAVVCSTSLMDSLMKHEIPARCRASRSVKQSSGLQKDHKFKFKYFIASYTWQCVYRGSCNKVSHTHNENLTKYNITKKLC